MSDQWYADLCAPFAEGETFKLTKGGTDLVYVTGEAVTTRLNTVLGVDGWTFDLVEHGHDERHAWALGKLTVHFPDQVISRMQFGECGTNPGMGLGDARKAAATDSIKKCASLIGVGLYLSHKAEVEQATRAAAAPMVRTRNAGNCPDCGSQPCRCGAPRTLRARSDSQVWQDLPAEEEAEIGCADCGELLTPWRRKDGTTWSAARVAEYAQQKFGRTLCWNCGKRQTG